MKLVLNSLSGLLDNKHSPLYFPEGALRMRIAGQLIISKLMETVIKNGWRVVSVNTDGLEAIIPKGDFEKYKTALKEVEEFFNIDLEHEIYKQIGYLNVNNYHAITMDGKVKRKGMFKFHGDIPLGDSVNEQIIPFAINEYFVNGTRPEDVITNPDKYNLSIYDYCVSKKIAKNYTVFWGDLTTQNVNRYFFSKRGKYLMKLKRGKNVKENVHKGDRLILLNKYIDQPTLKYDINFEYYIAKCHEIIANVETFIRKPTLF